jgi:uncharacterized protein (TIGR02588 family)
VWEWAAAGAGGLITAAAISFLVYDNATTESKPLPRIVVRVDTIIAHASSYVVEFRATNEGDATAAHVVVHGELMSDTGAIERSESNVDFVPARSWRTGGLIFRNDPRRYRLEVRPVGFDRP